ncbi:uncharacterized protein LOC111617934 [Centruroides sculpturatus]|uniref:uncharacterized protein LOC111617934 n=1 Tax=Centruroides sculpturatus TaxID=218467 RepID=UPI000C6ED88C|nr:uncharacterized protein LOC111617934 [Centruroides sculpturatus]
MDKFPYADIMEMQDILLFSEWNVQQAIAFVQEHRSPFTYGRNSYNSDDMKYKRRRVNNYVNIGLDEDSHEVTSDGWLARANKETLKTYSKNISERKVVHSNTKPIVFYGSKERARIKRQVENFILKQNNKPSLNEYHSQDNSKTDNSLQEIHIKVEK